MAQPKKKLSRRKFIRNSGLASAGFFIVPRSVLGGKGYIAPSDQLNIAGIGVGGRGAGILRDASEQEGVNIVALCDVDWNRAKDSFSRFPEAKKYYDFRELYEKQKDIDAIMVGTPDHIHAIAAMPAIQRGKHVYVEKPLTHNIKEARLLTEAAREKGIVTQMGNQGSSGDGVRLIQEWIDAGIIGDVTKVHCWTNRPLWPQGVATPTGQHSIPKDLNWDLWLGPAKMRDYNPAYLPFKWRGWWDFGTGALGDMGCHIIDPAFKALRLGYPTSVEASVGQVYSGDFVLADTPESCPPSSKVHYDFPARKGMPAVELVWYDGGILPRRPVELGPNESMGDSGGGTLFEGTRGKIVCGVYGRDPKLLPYKAMDYFKQPKPRLPRIEEGHVGSWVKACREGTPTSSNFDYAGPLTETVLMGNLAIRSYNLQQLKPGKKATDWDPWMFPGRLRLNWDGPNMRVTNFDAANEFVSRDYRKGFEL
jgi:predicted dehydrogenase